MSIFKLKINTQLIALILIIGVSSTFYAQQSSRGDFWNHVRFGGGIGLGFGDGYFSGTITPSAIYQFNPVVAMGVGLNGTYNKRKDYYKSFIVGGSVLGLFNPIPSIQFSVEFEELNISREWDDYYELENENFWYPALFFGIGYSTNNVTLGIRYDVLYNRDQSIYADPWIPFVRFYF